MIDLNSPQQGADSSKGNNLSENVSNQHKVRPIPSQNLTTDERRKISNNTSKAKNTYKEIANKNREINTNGSISSVIKDLAKAMGFRYECNKYRKDAQYRKEAGTSFYHDNLIIRQYKKNKKRPKF